MPPHCAVTLTSQTIRQNSSQRPAGQPPFLSPQIHEIPYSEHALRILFLQLCACLLFALPLHAQEDEIVANLAGGRAIIHVAGESILFAAIDHPLEPTSVPPRVAEIDPTHIAIFFGATEWQVPAQPRPIRLDHDIEHVYARDPNYQTPGQAESDLEQIGLGFLEKLRPLVAQLHHKIDLKPDEPLFELVLLGYGPKGYGAEVWLLEFSVEQQIISSQNDYWQTKVLRPRFTQLYPPEKKQPKTLLEVRFPSNSPDIPLQGLIQQNDPRITRLRSSDARFNKVAEHIDRGEAQKALPQDAADFLRAAVPLLAGNSKFIMGQMGENGAFEWIVPPEEPIEKQKHPEDKDRPPDAPTLRKRPNQTP